MTRATKTRAIAGVVLAGGQSRRMGRDKADIMFRGQTFIERARSQLKSVGCSPVIVSGRPGLPDGIADHRPGQGPAQAMYDALKTLPPHCEGALFIPVDMPLMVPHDLTPLLPGEENRGLAWTNHPLPVYLPSGSNLPERDDVHSVKYLLSCLDVSWLDLPAEHQSRFRNINTPEDVGQLD